MMRDISELEHVANEKLKEIYGSLDNVELPVNINKIVDHFELNTYVFDDPQWSHISGAWDREKNAIYINNNDSPRRQAFTLAHEIAHYCLHQDQKYDVLQRKNFPYTEETDDKEKEADAFAAALLMPRELVKNQWDMVPTVSAIASQFGVSSSTASYRLKSMGLIT